MSNQPLSALEPHREILWNVGSPVGVFLMYLLFVLSLAVAGYGLLLRLSLWAGGRPAPERFGSWHKRLGIFLSDILGQRRVNRDAQTASFHLPIFTGFLVLTFTTTMVFLSHDLGLTQFYSGKFYLLVTVFSDLFGLLLLLGVLRAVNRRFILKPDRLHISKADFLILAFLAAMVVQGFLLEALRIKVTSDPWRQYSFVGNWISYLVWPLSMEACKWAHALIWWSHTVTVFAFIALLPYTKFLHIIASSVNLFFRDLSRPKGALASPGDIDQILEQVGETGEDFRVGIATIEDLTWKQRLDLDSCTSCGRCQEVCPAYNSGKMLSPKWLILDSRDHLLKLWNDKKLQPGLDSPALKSLRNTPLGSLDSLLVEDLGLAVTQYTHRANNELVQNAAKTIGGSASAKLAGEVMDADVFWSCTTCRACMEVCPVGIEHLDLIVDVRRSEALMEGAIPTEAQASLRAIENRGNPFGPAEARVDWAAGLDIRVLGEGDSAEVLYWVGCVSAYDKRKQKIARSIATILNQAGVSWGILGNREHCSGDPARRLGEENLFQSSAKKNIATLSSIHVKTVVTNCPHCMNSLGNEYGPFGDFTRGGEVKVVHHSVYIQELIRSGKITLAKELDELTTFHDPCYLGRHNNTYDEPREVLVSIGGASKLREMEASREKGFCCGAGGGHFWMDMKVGERINVIRAEQAAATGATRVATGCPFCLQMMEDGMKLTDREQTHAVKDLAELVVEAMDLR